MRSLIWFTILCILFSTYQQILAAQIQTVSWQDVAAYCDTNGSPFCTTPLTQVDAWRSIAIPKAKGIASTAYARARPQLLALSASLAQSTTINSLTDFIFARVKEDLEAFGLQSFYDKVCSPSNGILPNTCAVLKPFAEGNGLPALSTLRTAVRADLTSLPQSALEKAAVRLSTDTAGGHQVLTARVATKDTVLTLLAITTWAYQAMAGHGLTGSIARTRNLLAGPSRLVTCIDTPLAATVWQFSALAEELFAGPQIPGPTPENSIKRVKAYENGIRALMVNAHALQLGEWPAGGMCAATSDTGSMILDLRSLYQLTMALEATDRVASLSLPVAGPQFLIQETQAGEESRMAHRTATVNGLFEIANALSVPQLDATLGDYLKTLHGLTLAVIAGQFAEVAFSLVRLPAIDEFFGDKSGYILALGDIAMASNSDAVTQAIGRVAAPRTGFLRKRNRGGRFYFSLNAYAGGIIGRERVEGIADGATYISPYIPVGIEGGASLSRGVLSVGLFGQFLDLGTLGAYRLRSAIGVDKAPEVGFKQVFSPAVSFVVGIGKIPLTAGLLILGESPSLRKVTSDGVAHDASVTQRWGLFTAFDVPLF